MSKLRLGVNVDHAATLRNARGEAYPDPVEIAKLAALAGADGVTAHLREDRRHINDNDIERLKAENDLPLNMEMAPTEEMLQIALNIKPHAVCLVPERREEVTTEGGMNVVNHMDILKPLISKLRDNDIRVSLFVNPDLALLDASKEVGADIVELHTGTYCLQSGERRAGELITLQEAAAYADSLGLECHAGHGLTFATVSEIAAIPQLKELNIGFFIMSEALYVGIDNVVKKMRTMMDQARK